MLTFEASPCSDSLYKQTCTLLSPISSHGLVVKRMTSNHEILGSTPSSLSMDIEWIYIAQKLELCFWSGQYWLVASGSKFGIRGVGGTLQNTTHNLGN
ncbi:hypothetical protein N7497_001331 [Penicillium chrysogenum]|nr:hypothetical protein N7497_001331 [Penicillium chrysogenum]